MNQYIDGIIEDPRTDIQKAQDYPHLEGGIILNWIEKTPDQWKKYTPREQDGSLSCCGQGSAKALETILGKVFSAHPIYRSRSNYPAGGMYLQDLGSILKNVGTTTEDLDISQWQNETTMNRDLIVETPFKIEGYFFPKIDIDEIAQAIELHKHCILIFHCNRAEWTATPMFNGAVVDFGHCVTGVDYFLHNGVKTLLIEDSTGHFSTLDKQGQRLITEDFLLKRWAGAMYVVEKLSVERYIFTKTLRLGDKGLDVKMLQSKLNIAVDGIFGMITLSAVQKFQHEHNLVADGIVGKLTIAKLME